MVILRVKYDGSVSLDNDASFNNKKERNIFGNYFRF
jgi:hypothetical protein